MKDTPHVNRSMDDLKAALPHILDAPKDNGRIDAIVVRPVPGKRVSVESVEMSLAGGVHGDHWSLGCWRSTEDGQPHPDVQICMMPSRSIEAIAGARDNWIASGDNLFIDMDLSRDNLPVGTRLAMGSVELIVTPERHNGCQTFIDLYGRDACVFVNTGAGRTHSLRGIYGRVVRDGHVSVGDRVRKLA